MNNESKPDVLHLAQLILRLQPQHMSCEKFSNVLLQLAVDLVTVELNDAEAHAVYRQAGLPLARAIALTHGDFIPLPQLACSMSRPESN